MKDHVGHLKKEFAGVLLSEEHSEIEYNARLAALKEMIRAMGGARSPADRYIGCSPPGP